MITPAFTYAEFTKRNIGFVTEAEQARLRQAKVFVCGTGGMGGAALMALARAGIGHFIIADLDGFEISNLNRQVFAFTDNVGCHKAEASADIIRRINPDATVDVLKADWPKALDRITREVQVIINGTDDLVASLQLYRTARSAGLAVIDAYASPLPSVYVTRPRDPSPEERLGYPTIGKALPDIRLKTGPPHFRPRQFMCSCIRVRATISISIWPVRLRPGNGAACHLRRWSSPQEC
jgi:molybdopterin-synthase adenylyltransferase